MTMPRRHRGRPVIAELQWQSPRRYAAAGVRSAPQALAGRTDREAEQLQRTTPPCPIAIWHPRVFRHAGRRSGARAPMQARRTASRCSSAFSLLNTRFPRSLIGRIGESQDEQIEASVRAAARALLVERHACQLLCSRRAATPRGSRSLARKSHSSSRVLSEATCHPFGPDVAGHHRRRRRDRRRTDRRRLTRPQGRARGFRRKRFVRGREARELPGARCPTAAGPLGHGRALLNPRELPRHAGLRAPRAKRP
jgi:hypothetical protein